MLMQPTTGTRRIEGTHPHLFHFYAFAWGCSSIFFPRQAPLLLYLLPRRDVEHRAIFQADTVDLAQHVAGKAELDDRHRLERRRDAVGQDLVELPGGLVERCLDR